MTGDWPEAEIDHIDGNPSNNAWSNLRAVNSQENNRNKRRPNTNKSGRIGVSWNERRRKWRARICVCGKRKYLGMFHELEDACHARQAAEILHGFHPNHGRA